MKFEHLGMVGYGEVGRIFAAGLRSAVAGVVAWDLKFANAAQREAALAHAAQADVAACGSMQALCAASDLVVSAVTASNTLAVAQEAEFQAEGQKNRALVVLAEAEIPKAISEALRKGSLGLMDYYRMQNMMADTAMRSQLGKPEGQA